MITNVFLIIKRTVHWYGSCAITHYFTSSNKLQNQTFTWLYNSCIKMAVDLAGSAHSYVGW